MTSEKHLQYEKILKGALLSNYIFIVVVVVAVIGLVLFVVWWRKRKKKDEEEFADIEVSEEAKVDKKVVVVSVLLITGVVIGALTSTTTSILQINKDLQNKAYVVVDTEFTVTKTDFGGRWRSTAYTVSYEKDGVNVEVNPNLKYWELTAGTYTDKVFVYALNSEIAVDVYPNT